MSNFFLSEIPNEELSEELKSKLNTLESFRKSIVIDKPGYLSVFVRDGHIGKITFQRNALNSIDVESAYDIEENPVPTPEFSVKDYRVFSYLIASSILHIDKIAYGTLRFQFKIEKTDAGKFNSRYSLTFDEEVHFKNERPSKTKNRY